MTHQDIIRMFTYHAPTDTQIKKYQHLRETAQTLGLAIIDCCPNSRQRDQAIELLQQAVMAANSAIAINEKDRSEVISDMAQQVTAKLEATKQMILAEP